MNTLEDAFINIGLDEEKFLNQGASCDLDAAVNFPELAEPESLSKGQLFSIEISIDVLLLAPTYSFWLQYKAMIMRRWLTFRRSPMAIVMFLLPILFIIGALLICASTTSGVV